MSDMLGISSNAISAYQRALSTVSNNIANVNTDGYSRQDVVLQDIAPTQQASMYVGSGVMLQTIRRQYDAFAEANLRSSTSDLSAQTPMVDYTQRVVNIMGDQTSGLSSALDTFFTSANALSADPASTVQRESFLTNATGVASRFAEVSGQLDQVATETSQAMQSTADQINTLTSQLALINQSMNNSPTLEGQAPQLLDRRDLALRQLSDLVRIQISYTSNGQVTVSLGKTMSQGLVVSGMKARPIGVDQSVKDKVAFVLDPYGKTEALPDLSGGKLGGYQIFTTQVLNPAQESLNHLAQVFVDQTNAIQQNGLDGYGQMGQALFTIDHTAAQKAGGIQLNISDGMRVAAAAQFRVSEGSSNISTTQASVTYSGSQPTSALSNSSIVNNPNPSAGVTFNVDGAKVYSPVTTLAAGVSATFYLDQMAPGQQLQVMTRDGQQILGQSLTETEKYQLLTPANGFSDNIHASDQYLNKSGSSAYRGLDFFYGAKADVLYQPNYDRNGLALPSTALPATLSTSRLTSPLAAINANALNVNGVSLGALTPTQTTSATIAGVTQGGASDFNGFGFQMKIGDKTLAVSPIVDANNNPVTSLSGLAAALQYQLRIADGSNDLSVQLSNNGQDIQIQDGQGRNISSLGLTLNASVVDAQASAGDVSVNSDAHQMVDWFNGTTQASMDGLNFGTGNPGFSSFKMNLGNVDFNLQFPATGNPTDVDSLAAYLQTQLRAMDHSTNISVVSSNGQLILDDKAGRSLQSLVLTPHADAQGANVGQLTIRQSNVSQSKVRADLVSQINVPVNQLDFSKSLSINGVVLQNFANANELIADINQSAAGVTATITSDGQISIANALGSPITLDKVTGGNTLNVSAGTYAPQMHMTQVMRDLTIPSTQLDFTKPLSLNGINITPGIASYDLPAPGTALSMAWGTQTLQANSPQALVAALNANSDFSNSDTAVLSSSGKLLIQSRDATQSDDSVAAAFTFQAAGATVQAQAGVASRDDLVQRIRDLSGQSGVTAFVNHNGDVVLSTTDTAGSADIAVGPGKNADGTSPANALGLPPLDYSVNQRIQRDLVDHLEDKDIRLSFGGNGDPSDLSKLGLRTAAYIQGGSPDDLLVFVTGKGSAKVAASFSGQPDNPRDSLRQQSLTVKFTAADRYNIIDAKTGTVLADRSYDPSVPNPVISFDGLQLQLSHAPSAGDTFAIDGNQDGLGNNVNMLDMADLAKKTVLNGKTLHDNYIDQINVVGNLGQQAKVSQAALQVVNDQDVASRDKVSGVSLDDEAAALIRYQQAYQAAAKALQVSSQLFDTVAQIK